MNFTLRGDGRGIDIRFQLSWRVAKALTVGLAALVAMPEISRLVALIGW